MIQSDIERSEPELRVGVQPEHVSGWSVWLGRLAPVLVFLSVVVAAGRAWHSHRPWMIFFQDDFYYYLKIAQNLAHGRGSTFNGIARTNGYHPLWLLVLTAFSTVTMNPRAVFPFVVGVVLVATIATFYLAAEWLRLEGMPYALRQALAAYLGIYAFHLFYTGMEVILAVPLVFLMMVVATRRDYWQRGFGEAASLGLIVALMALARLDLILLATIMLVAALANGEVRRSMTRTQVAGILVGLLPLAVYFAVNRTYFGTWMPISGMAKQLRFHAGPVMRPWFMVYMPNLWNRLNLLPIHVAVLTLPFVWRRLKGSERVLFPSLLLYPFLYVFVLSCVSDWQLWLWYLYPLRAALCVAFAIFWILPPTRWLLRQPWVAALVMLVVVAQVAVSAWWTDVQPSIQAAAVEIQDFASTHPGTYAMGDRAGMVGYLLPYPLLQTEGLVMDKAYLERIKHQEPLLPVLAAYGVRYYVGTAWAPYTGCFHAIEPFQAGFDSAHMVGDLCSQPLATFQHERYRTLIFDLEKEPALAGK